MPSITDDPQIIAMPVTLRTLVGEPELWYPSPTATYKQMYIRRQREVSPWPTFGATHSGRLILKPPHASIVVSMGPGIVGPRVEVETPIDRAIANSQYLLHLEDDWDGEGADAYREHTWNRAIGILRDLVTLARAYGWSVEPPAISPADGGSIDLFWEDDMRMLLINVPAGESEPMTYFGQKRSGKESIQGIMTGALRRPDIAVWIHGAI